MQFLVTGENFNKILDALNDFDDMDVLSIAVDESNFQIKNITNIGEGIKWIGESKRNTTGRRRRNQKEDGGNEEQPTAIRTVTANDSGRTESGSRKEEGNI